MQSIARRDRVHPPLCYCLMRVPTDRYHLEAEFHKPVVRGTRFEFEIVAIKLTGLRPEPCTIGVSNSVDICTEFSSNTTVIQLNVCSREGALQDFTVADKNHQHRTTAYGARE